MTDVSIIDPREKIVTKVTKSGQLVTCASTIPEMGNISRTKARAFEFHPPRMVVDDGDSMIIRFKNTHPEDLFVVNLVKVYWNGGNISPRDKPLILRTYINTAEPDGQVTTGQFGASLAPHNMNLASNKTPEVDFKFWNGVTTNGAGMTISNAQYTGDSQTGYQINCGFFSQGYTPWTYDGALILAPNSVLGISAESEEGDGQAIVVINGYFYESET